MVKNREFDGIVTLSNVNDVLLNYDVLTMEYVYEFNRDRYFEIKNEITVELSNFDIINIKKGFRWDLSSVPKILWPVLSPYGDFLLAALIHDFLYVNKLYTRKFADKEMLIWSNKINKKKLDNYARFAGVRAFGWLYWNGILKFKKS